MIYDILEVFKGQYKEKGDKLILDSYGLKEGLYIKINKDDTSKYFLVKKKNRELIFTDIDGNINSNAYQWFKERDYYSGYLNSNKAFFDKKIHNINYFSLFVKIDSFVSNNPKKILQKEVLKNHYLNLCNYKKFTKPSEKEILASFEDYLSNKERKKDIIRKYRFIRDNLDSIVKIAKENNVKNYIKIFFDEPIEKYKAESGIYYSLKIFNDIKYSEHIGNEIFGLSNSNMGLNSKKPFLEHKTKLKTIPFLMTNKNAILLKKFFDWLKIQPYKDENNKPIDRYLDDNFFMQKHSANDEAEITDFDYIPLEINKFENPIIIKNYLWLKSEKNVIENKKIEYLFQLEQEVDDIFYNRQLINNYYGEVWKKLDNSFANFIYITRESMISYFRKYDDRNFYRTIKKYGSKLVIEHIKKDRLFKAGLALNLKFSLLKYKGEKVMDIKKMQKQIMDKLSDSDYKGLEKDEFFYLCGQVARYLINQSQKSDKKGDMLEPYLRANSSLKLKRVLETDYFKYKHAINLHFVKFNNAMSLIMAFDNDEKLSSSPNMDNFLIGALSDNIFYMKNEG